MPPPERYKFCIDENLPHYLAKHLRIIYRGHTFSSVQSLQLKGSKDVPLFEKLQGKGFDAIVTNDLAQVKLYDPTERLSLRTAGMHWVGTAQATGFGRGALARTCATVISGLGEVLNTWRVDPCLYWIDPTRTTVSAPESL